jgi:hypothetical protein
VNGRMVRWPRPFESSLILALSGGCRPITPLRIALRAKRSYKPHKSGVNGALLQARAIGRMDPRRWGAEATQTRGEESGPAGSYSGRYACTGRLWLQRHHAQVGAKRRLTR